MWKNYSKSYIKNNRASSKSVMQAAFIATMFLSLLCCVAYNFWTYEIESIVLDEGDWQGRIIGEINENDVATVQNFANVKEAVINTDLSDKKNTVLDIYFQNARTIYRDMPLILEQLGLDSDAVEYHSLLLSFLGFSIMLCFTTLSAISTRYTYFERYQDAWDIMVTVKDTTISDFDLTDEVKAVSGIGDVTLYQLFRLLFPDWHHSKP